MQIWKKLAQLLFSHVGLTVLLILYALLGALILRAIEGPREEKDLQKTWQKHVEIEYMKMEIRDYVMKLAANTNKQVYKCNFFFIDGDDLWATGTNEEVVREEHALREYTVHSSQQVPPTCFEGPIEHLSCVPETCIHICETEPMNDVCLQGQNRIIEKLIQEKIDKWHGMIEFAISEHSYTGQFPNADSYQWSFFSIVVYCITAYTLIGYGHLTPDTDLARLFIIIYSLLGIVLFLMFTANVGRLFSSAVRYTYIKCCCRVCFKQRDRTNDSYYRDSKGNLSLTPVAENGDTNLNEEEILAAEIARLENINEDDLEEILRDTRVPVPLSLSLLIIVAYIIAGALLFSNWEGWSFCPSLYFTVVTLATIGFGELIPGLDKGSTVAGKLKLTVTVLYIVLGLAIIGMGIDMLVYAYESRIKKIAKTVGILERKINPENGQEEEEERRNTKFSKVKVAEF